MLERKLFSVCRREALFGFNGTLRVARDETSRINSPIKKKARAAPLASNKFFNMVFWTFFRRTQPAQSMAKPACIKKIIAPATT